MTRNPKISVLLSIYNVDKYLEECLNSLLAQSYENLEIICVDNGSPDKCGEILKEYAQKDKRIKVITLKENIKLCGGRNVGLDHATGDYICFVDPDDWVEKDHIKVMVDAAENLKDSEGKPYNLILNYNAINYVVLEDGSRNKISGWGNIEPGEKTLQDFNNNPNIDVAIPMWGRLYRKCFIDQHKDVHFLEGINADNIPYTLKLLAHMKRFYCIQGEQNAMYWRRLISPEGVITPKILYESFELLTCLENLFDYLKKYGLEKKVKVPFVWMFHCCFPKHTDMPRFYKKAKQLLRKMEDTIKSSPIYKQEDIDLCNLLLYTDSFFEFINLFFHSSKVSSFYTEKTKLFGFIPFWYVKHYEDKIHYSLFKFPRFKLVYKYKRRTFYLFHCIPLMTITR